MRQSYIQTRTVDVPANNQHIALEVPGEFLLITAATGDFEISLDSTDWFPGLIGLKRVQKDPDGFIRVSFRSATAQAVTFVAGSGDYSGSRVQVTATLTPADIVALVGTGVDVTAGSARITNAQTYVDRRSLSVFNAGAANITANGTIVAAGQFLGWRVDRHLDRLTDITIDATGSIALVSWTI